MSKKFKLIKKYPGSPKLEFTVEFKLGFSHVSPAVIRAGIKCNLSLEECQKHSEFWEEIIEEKYQLLKLVFIKSDKKGEVLDADLFEKVKDNYDSSLFRVYSLKRTSDNEIITIGDRVSMPNISQSYNSIDFQSYSIIKRLDIRTERYSCSEINHWKSLKDCVKLTPFLTTEDGVDIFKNDIYWWVDKSFHYTYVNGIIGEKHTVSTSNLYFSRKEAVLQYIEMNKHYLSINEVISCYDKNQETLVNNLKELIKRK
jgi:hypothetical protein